MPQPLTDALDELRGQLTDPERLVRAVAAGKRRSGTPQWVRAELRPVTLKGVRRLQVVVTSDRPHTRNVDFTDPVVAELLAEPFGNWHVETVSETIQLRVTKKGEAQVSRHAAAHTAVTSHDRAKEHLLAPDDPIYRLIGGNAAKRRQVDAFLRALDATLGRRPAGSGNATNRLAPDAASGDPSTPATDGDSPHPSAGDSAAPTAGAAELAPGTPGRLLRIVDLGCGNAYLTFAAYRYLTSQGIDAELIGVDVRADQRDRNTALAEELGWADKVRFVAGTILEAPVESADVVLALHACDTASDEALARAVGWGAEHILVAPCCHHDIAAQLKKHPSPLVGQPILRERFADVLTDSLRALILRQHGYRVEVTEFVDSAHTPRNLLLRATRTGTVSGGTEFAALVDEWHVAPHLGTLLTT
ncbi:SAM-dependent methyltransferase [Longispora sp. NPDC051575]|uniref:class I SAM-dependent methyltransferase n=1 Tax=Longispora sp. NPDC051575 TaxID=3154943 RepID=UPI003438B10F